MYLSYYKNKSPLYVTFYFVRSYIAFSRFFGVLAISEITVTSEFKV